MRYLFSFLVFLSGFASLAQTLDSTTTFNGEQFCLHKLEQGETLYQLCGKYNVSFSSVREANPDKGDSLDLGEIVRIPCDISTSVKVDAIVQSDIPAAEESPIELAPGYLLHDVQQGETEYSLIIKYNTTKKRFYKDNPSVVVTGLKTGQKVLFYDESIIVAANLEGINKVVQSFASKIDAASMADSNVFRVGLLLPFNLEQNRKRMQDVEAGKEVEIMNQTKYFLEFVQGAKFAIDSIKNKGTNVQVFVFDSKSDTSHIATIMNGVEFKSLDMVFGPAFGHNFEYVAKKLNGTGIYLVSPYGKKMSVIAHNPKVIKCRSSVVSRVGHLAEFLYYHHKSDNIILTYENDDDLHLVQKVQATILGLSSLQDTTVIDSPAIVKGVYEPVGKLNASRKNIVVSMNTTESFATKLVVKMQNKHKDFEIILVGMEEWKSYKNIEVRYWESLSMHLVGNLDFRYLGVKNESFFKSYFTVNHTEPSYHAVLGYELVLNLLGKVENNTFIPGQLTGKLIEGEISKYMFRNTGDDTGINNTSATVYKYQGFKFVPAKN